MRTGKRSEWETLNAHAKVLTSLSSPATARRAHKLSKIEAQGCQKTIKNSLNGLNAISCVPHSLPRFAYFGAEWPRMCTVCVAIILSACCWSFIRAHIAWYVSNEFSLNLFFLQIEKSSLSNSSSRVNKLVKLNAG